MAASATPTSTIRRAISMDGAHLCRTAIQEIANEDRLALLVTLGAGAEKRLQLVRLPVDVSDDVVGHRLAATTKMPSSTSIVNGGSRP